MKLYISILQVFSIWLGEVAQHFKSQGKRKERYLNLNRETCGFIKLCSAIMIASHHYSSYALSANLSQSFIYKVQSAYCGYLGVAIFFFLSGYGLMESEQRQHLGAVRFIKRRFLKIYLPVVLVTAIWLLFSYFYMATAENHDVGFFIKELLFGFSDGVLWFVKILFLLYAAFYLFTLVLKRHEVLGWSVLVISTMIICRIVNDTIGDWAYISVSLFGIGAFASRYRRINLGEFNIALLPLVLSALILFFCSRIGFYVLLNHLAIGLLIVLCTRYEIRIVIPTVLGLISFDIYLVHNKLLMTLRDSVEVTPLCFLLGTALFTFLFYYLRTKMLKI